MNILKLLNNLGYSDTILTIKSHKELEHFWNSTVCYEIKKGLYFTKEVSSHLSFISSIKEKGEADTLVCFRIFGGKIRGLGKFSFYNNDISFKNYKFVNYSTLLNSNIVFLREIYNLLDLDF